MNFVGAVACKRGWFAVALDQPDAWEIAIFEIIDDSWEKFWTAEQYGWDPLPQLSGHTILIVMDFGGEIRYTAANLRSLKNRH